jgi:DNA-binding NtrC family response regulator
MADDDPQIRQLNRRLLVEEGFDVVEAADGVEALELLVRRSAAVAVIDLRMPRLDGYALSEVVAARWPETAMIFITAHPDYDRCQDLPGPLLIKPYYLAELVTLVHRLADDDCLRPGEPAGRGRGRRAPDWWSPGQ